MLKVAPGRIPLRKGLASLASPAEEEEEEEASPPCSPFSPRPQAATASAALQAAVMVRPRPPSREVRPPRPLSFSFGGGPARLGAPRLRLTDANTAVGEGGAVGRRVAWNRCTEQGSHQGNEWWVVKSKYLTPSPQGRRT